MTLRQALPADYAQTFLVEHLRRTQGRFDRALDELGGGRVTITTAADLGLPASVERLAGGFTSGCVVQWESPLDVLPVDTSAAIDTSTVLVLDRMPERLRRADAFEEARERVDRTSSYQWNFHLGNHFIILGERAGDGAPVLVVHSSECEFDHQVNGLLPHADNWYWPDVRTFTDPDGSYLRLLGGPRARRFAALSRSLIEYSQLRHEVIVELLLAGSASIVECYHKPHFFMAGERTIVLGCYLCDPGEEVPVFSRHGQDIDIFRCQGGGQNTVTLENGESKVVVLHGWGRTTSAPIELRVSQGKAVFNGRTYPIEPGASIATHPDVVLRDFDSSGNASLWAAVGSHTPGTVVDRIRQISSYSCSGFAEH